MEGIMILSRLAIAATIFSFVFCTQAFAKTDKFYVSMRIPQQDIQTMLKELMNRDFDVAGVDLKSQVVGLVVSDSEMEWLDTNLLILDGIVLLEKQEILPLKMLRTNQEFPDKEYFNPVSLSKSLKELHAVHTLTSIVDVNGDALCVTTTMKIVYFVNIVK